MQNDVYVLRELATQVKEISQKLVQERKRDMWRKHNSLIKTEVPIIVAMGSWDVMKNEIITEEDLKCVNPVFRDLEFDLRHKIFLDGIEDDNIMESRIDVNAVYACEGWGTQINHTIPEQGGAYHLTPTIVEEGDFSKLIVPRHAIDNEKTKEKLDCVKDAIGDIINVNLNTSPDYLNFRGDISYWLGQLLGMEQIMYYMYDREDWLKKILAFLRDGILKVHSEATQSDSWNSGASYNQAMSYSNELPDPDGLSSTKDKLWGFFAAQEFDMISPEMHKEFLLDFQIPIMEGFGLVAYGCCENLTKKIDMLKSIPNLRRIAVSPFANARQCAEQIKRDYVLSYRPNPANLLMDKWDSRIIKECVKDDIESCGDCIYDITLKDVITIKNEAWRIKEWVKIMRETAII